MQSGSINPGAPKSVAQRKAVNEAAAPNSGAETENAAAVEQEQAENLATASSPEDTLPLGFVVDADSRLLEQDKDGNYVRTLAFVPVAERERLEKQGAVFPEMKNALLGDGVGPDGEISVLALYDTNNAQTKQVARAVEIDRKLLQTDPETGQPLYENMTPVLLAQGEGVLPAGSKAVPNGASVIPDGYHPTLKLSKEAAKVKGQKALANNLTKSLGSFSGSSLAGIMTLPVISQAAPLIALGTVGFSVNQNLEAKQEAKTRLGYLGEQVLKSSNDMVELQTPEGYSYKVSGKSERARLESEVRKANFQLASSGLLAAAGGSAIVGAMATAGVEGFAGLAGAAAATPWLAGGSLLLGSGTMVFESLAQLKALSKEKAELEKMQAEGKTHVDRVFEGIDPNLKRPVAVGEKPVAVPIEERLKEITKAQSTERLKATAFTGLMGSMANLVSGAGAGIGLGAGAVAGLALTPAAVVLGAQSLAELKKLGTERKELEALAAKGETMVERPLQQADLSYQTERVPISTLLAENKKARNLNKMKLTAAGSFAGGIALGVGAGFGMAAAAPAVLVPLAVGALLYPEKVKEFGQKIQDFISGRFGEAAKLDKATRQQTEALADEFAKKLEQHWAGLKESSPHLFEERPGYLERVGNVARGSGGVVGAAISPIAGFKAQPGGYFHELQRDVLEFAKASDPVQRAEIQKHMQELIKYVPDEAVAGLAVFQEEFAKLAPEIASKWAARDIELELKTPTTAKVLSDDRVQARLNDLGFSTEDIRDQYKESLLLRHDPLLYPDTVQASQAGDRDASRKLARAEVFAAAQLVAAKERQLGPELFAKYMDALQRPEDTDNLELVTKEVSYRQQVAVTTEDVNQMVGAVRTLTTPLTLAPENAAPHQAKLQQAFTELSAADPELAQKLSETNEKLTNSDGFKGMNAQEALAERTKLNAQFQAARRGLRSKAPEALKAWLEADEKLRSLPAEQLSAAPQQPVLLQGPEARMTNAVRGLTAKNPELSREFTEAFYQLNDLSRLEGLDAAQAQQSKLEAQIKFDKVRGKVQKEAPELLALWEGARKEAETSHFERQMDYDLKDKVLAKAEIADAAKELGLTEDDVNGLYMGLMRSQILADPRDLQNRLADESGKKIDEKKSSMLQVIDRALLRTIAEETHGGADFKDPAEASANPLEDPTVQAWLQQRPDVINALNSEGFAEMSGKLNLPVDQVQQAYLTLAQADLNPILAAEFKGRLEGGDMQAVNIYQVGQEALKYIQEFVKPDPEQVKAAVEQQMAGPVIGTVLADAGIKAKAEELGVDAEATLRLYLSAELGRDPSGLAALEQRAQKGDTAAAGQLQFLQEAIPAVHYVNQQLQSGAA